MVSLVNRLMDTVADSSEDVQGYVTEMLLTLKMNANLFAFQYLKSSNELAASKETANTGMGKTTFFLMLNLFALALLMLI